MPEFPVDQQDQAHQYYKHCSNEGKDLGSDKAYFPGLGIQIRTGKVQAGESLFRRRLLVGNIGAEIHRTMSPHLVKTGLHLVGKTHLEWSLQLLPVREGHKIVHGPQGRIEQGCLITIAKGRDGRLQLGMQFQPEMRGDNQIARPLRLARMGQPRVQIGREKEGMGKVTPQCLKDHELVVYIAPQHADGLELSILRRLLIFQSLDEATEVIELTSTCRSLRRALRHTQCAVAYLPLGLGTGGFFLVILGRQLAVEAREIRITMHPGRILLIPKRIDVILKWVMVFPALVLVLRHSVRHSHKGLRKRPSIERIPFCNQSNVWNLPPFVPLIAHTFVITALLALPMLPFDGEIDPAAFQFLYQLRGQHSIGSDRPHKSHPACREPALDRLGSVFLWDISEQERIRRRGPGGIEGQPLQSSPGYLNLEVGRGHWSACYWFRPFGIPRF